ncbi:MAG: hypothetical protein ACOH5I_09400 [Oligoflexus sp.]
MTGKAKTRTIGLCLTLMLACGKEGDDKGKGGGQGRGNDAANLVFGKASLISSDLNQASLAEASGPPEACDFSIDIYRAEGSCLTPISFIGYAGVLNTASENGGGARLASTFNYHESANGAIQSGLEVDFADGSSFSAYNELWDQYESKADYQYASLSLTYEKLKFKVKEKFVTMFIASYSQPFTAWDAAFEGCDITEEQRQHERYIAADLLTGMSFQRGDYLFCIKDAIDESCAADDYQWFDIDSATLVSERPDNPRQHQFLVNDSPSCRTEGDDRHNPSFSPIRVGGIFQSTFQLYADFSHGINSHQWKDSVVAFEKAEENSNEDGDNYVDPWLVYYHKAANSDDIVTGSQLDMTFDFDMEDLVYFDAIAANEFDTLSLEEILAKSYAKHDWYFQKKAEDNLISFEIKDYAHLLIDATINVTGEIDQAPTDSSEDDDDSTDEEASE